MDAQNIYESLKEKTPEEQLELTGAMLEADPDSAPVHIARGKALWRLGRRGEAMSEYSIADRLAPDGEARTLIDHSNAIMDFFNPDLLNP
mgnify:CR=1 FL=1